MATEAQNLPFSCLPCLYFLLSAIVALHLSRVLYKSTLFMQNKANLLDTQMNVTSFYTVDYENIANWKLGENKANTKPKQSQNKPNLLNAQINVSSCFTMNYEQLTMNSANKNKPNSKPISVPLAPFIVYNCLQGLRI